jgi:hypothetical protein
MRTSKAFAFGLTFTLAMLLVAGISRAQAPPADAGAEKAADAAPAVDPAAEPKPIDELALEQSRVADKYARLEQLILRMAEFEATANPRRAELLKQAVLQSKDRLTKTQLDAIVRLLGQNQFTRAIEGQGVAVTDMKALLDLLLSEDRNDRLKSEQQRIKEYIKELERMRKLEAANRGRNEGGADQAELAKDQGSIADRVAALDKKIGEQEGSSKGANEGNNKGDSEGNSKGDSEGNSKGDSEGKSKGDSEGNSKGDSEGKNKGDSEGNSKGDSEGKSKGDSEGNSKGDSEGKSKGDSEGNSKGDSEGKSKGDSEGNSKGDSEGKSKGDSEGNSKGDSEGNSKGDSEGNSKGDSEGNKKGDSQGDSKGDSQGDSKGDSEGGSAPGGEKPKQDDMPARKRIQEAEQKMREAKQKLEEAKRGESIEAQRAAEEKLKEAIAELEEILRQLREEEIERMLAMLEGRFRKMLEMELKIYEGTMRLDKIPSDQRGREVDIQANKLSFDQRKVAIEADRALTLLLEEGSSIAFPETVEQMRDDMEQVAERLAEVKVERITQGIEEDIIQTLEEIIEALQKAQQEMESKKNEPMPPPPPQPPQDQPLVDELAELKMIRALQLRVNTRTQRYAKLLDNIDDPKGLAADAELREALTKLAEREQSIHQITRDIVLGKNK